MKTTLLSTTVLFAILLASCGEQVPTEEIADGAETVTEVVKETVEDITEVTDDPNKVVEDQITHYEELLELTSTESVVSDCYISETFVYMDAQYITVDFVDYELVEGTEHTDHETYTLINNNTKLRTFAVNDEYFDCGHDKMVTLIKLIEKSKADPSLVFSLEVVDGVVTELYIDICSG